MKILNNHTVTKKQQRLILGVLFFLSVLFLHNNVLRLHIASLRAAQQYEKATDVRIRKESVLNIQVKAKRVELRKLLEECEVCQNVLFTHAEAQKFLSTLDETCLDAGCNVLAVDNSLPSCTHEISSEYGELVIVSQTVGLTISGTYNHILNLMEELECQSHKVWFDRLHLSTDRLDSGVIHCQVWLTIYVNQDKEREGHEEVPEDN